MSKFTSPLARAFAHHRRAGAYLQHAMLLARADVAAGRQRYAETIHDGLKGFTWQREAAEHDAIGTWANPFPAKASRLAYVESPENFGLRFVGRVEVESSRFTTKDSCGWLTDPFGDVSKDGTGLCFGVVYQLPGYKSRSRFVAGYQMGGTDAGPTIDFSMIYESQDNETDPRDNEEAREAASAADGMARVAAEQECEYQTAWQAGSRYAACREELAGIRKSVLEIIRDLKGACATVSALPASVKRRIGDSIRTELSERASLFAEMERLADGRDDRLGFSTRDSRLAAAFNDGACVTVI